MLIVSYKPGHDGGVAAIKDGRLVLSLESEKDSHPRFSTLTPNSVLELAELVGDLPDVIAVGGWENAAIDGFTGPRDMDAGYYSPDAVISRTSRFFGKEVSFFSSSHVRSHIFGSLGMAPEPATFPQVVLVWEGSVGAFYVVDADHRVVRTVHVMDSPGAKYAALFEICDPTFPATGGRRRLSDAGKLMALSAYADPKTAGPDIVEAVDRLLKTDVLHPVPKEDFRNTPLFDCGVRSETGTMAAAVITERIFRAFAEAAVRELPAGLPLRISGGCGLNCDWNSAWVSLGHFSDVFVPPCPNDSGSALGTALDAQASLTGSPHIEWNVYSGLEFVSDRVPDPQRWRREPLHHTDLADSLARGNIAAWVQGRWEMGPRALGNRSLLAEPFSRATKDRLNSVKQREDNRPIAPCARVEDLSSAFMEDFEDPYMLYFRRVRNTALQAVTHVDGSARVQTVSAASNARLHDLLNAFARRSGSGVLCNTSLNFPGHGFINRMSDLVTYCEARGITEMVVGDSWYHRVDT